MKLWSGVIEGRTSVVTGSIIFTPRNLLLTALVYSSPITSHMIFPTCYLCLSVKKQQFLHQQEESTLYKEHISFLLGRLPQYS